MSEIKIVNKKFGEISIDSVSFYNQPELIVNSIERLLQENQQLKEQLSKEKDDFKEFVKLGDKELKESINNLEGTQFLDAFCVLQWINVTRKENRQLKNQLKQRDEVIEEAISKLGRYADQMTNNGNA